MTKEKKKLTTGQKRTKMNAKSKSRQKYMWIFVNGKQVRVKRPPTVEKIDLDDFIQQNADPAWLHQNEMWEYIQADENEEIF